MTARMNHAMITLLSLLAMSRGGRVALHIACIVAGSDPVMHWQGVRRDLFGRDA